MSFVCADSGYHQRVVRSKSDVPPGRMEEYLGNFYFGRHNESDFIDWCQEYWHDWSGTSTFPTDLYEKKCYDELFPYDCTRAYAGASYGDGTGTCGKCGISRHLWASPFDSWAMISLHLARDAHMYPQANDPDGPSKPVAWRRNRQVILDAACTLSRVAAAMARSPTTRASTAWLAPDSGFLRKNPSLARVKMGGTHRAQPLSHYYEKGANRLYFLAEWATRSDATAHYAQVRNDRAKIGEMLREMAASGFGGGDRAGNRDDEGRRSREDPWYHGFEGAATVSLTRAAEEHRQHQLRNRQTANVNATSIIVAFSMTTDLGWDGYQISSNNAGGGTGGSCTACPVSCGSSCGNSACATDLVLTELSHDCGGSM
ncbi:unnamed protein product [Parascedosporium putredinis]|uniref:Uncharacterized protein n=1 Tax=Parascedosporium putredinis TaxID=1442378 RepID=A0A9P1H3T3_9PEZI|nr:unnamed protein product [Parascedosporium putredinis]CAI7996133.1 unnamed protein product [Parascedosporium putredinis]